MSLLRRTSLGLVVSVCVAALAASASFASGGGPQPPNVPQGQTPLPKTTTSTGAGPGTVTPLDETGFGSCLVASTAPDSAGGYVVSDAVIHSCPGYVVAASIGGCVYKYIPDKGFWGAVGCNAEPDTSVTIAGPCQGHGTYAAWGTAYAYSALPGISWTSSGAWATQSKTAC
jgi:hypothetical protein